MKTLKCTKTNKTTKITANEIGEPDIGAAANRLVARDWPGHYAGGMTETSDGSGEWSAEVCRSVGGLTEHTGEHVHFTTI